MKRAGAGVAVAALLGCAGTQSDLGGVAGTSSVEFGGRAGASESAAGGLSGSQQATGGAGGAKTLGFGGAPAGMGGASTAGGGRTTGGSSTAGAMSAHGGRATGGGSGGGTGGRRGEMNTGGLGGAVAGRSGGGTGGRGNAGSAGAGASGGMSGAANAGGAGGHEFPPKFAGNIDTRGSIRSDFATYWNQFSPENAGKWGSVQPNSQDAFNWTTLDAMYKYAGDHNIIFKQHNFIWGSQQPSWTSKLTTSTGPAAVQNWMNAFCQRYPNTRLIDVVNEPPPHTTPPYLNAIGGAGSSGYDWIANAFKWARQACPNAILILNDYNNVELSGDVQHTIDIVNAIKKAGAPIDAIGCQTHGAANLSAATLKSNIDKLTGGTGLPVYITEYDLNIADDAKQASVMQDQFTMFWNEANVKGITYWGYVVGSTWETNTGLMQSNGTPRPALTWLMQFLGR